MELRQKEWEKGERHLSPSKRTKDEANNGEAFSEAEVAGCFIFSEIEREGDREGSYKKRRDEC